ncbi:MAG: substrate-binding domain-containing protein [Bifidobacteriaceae bacterium]|jgi:simple sugar transport system substrate-binding protein|nr:substrate-binding domain-containing protein [Bifidobacteriaceae bacterium]MCI1979562.1 substrate-binding domain-containing protein [Bifidobacteriaceae bacterium]
MKKLFATIAAFLVALGLVCGLSACGQVDDDSTGVSAPKEDLPIVGYVAIGPETAWRTAHENDVQTAFKEAGMDMVYLPYADHDKQVAAVKKLIRDKVDAILLTPAQAEGWTTVLQSAKAADIPVFLVERGIEGDDPTLYTAKIGPSNTWAGQQVAKYLNDTFPDGAKGFLLEGPTTASSVQERTAAIEDSLNDTIAIVDSAEGDWSTETAATQTKELMEKFKDNDISFIVAENDEMAIGASQEIKDEGLEDTVKIVSIGGTKQALKALVGGQLSYVVEYNPLFGEKTASLVQKVLNGEKVAKSTTVSSQVFTPETAEEALPKRKF